MYKTTATPAEVTMSWVCDRCESSGPLKGPDDRSARLHAEHTGHAVKVGRLLQWKIKVVRDTVTASSR